MCVPERPGIQFGSHLQVVFAETKGAANVRNIDAQLSEAANALNRWLCTTEYGRLPQRMYRLNQFIRVLVIHSIVQSKPEYLCRHYAIRRFQIFKTIYSLAMLIFTFVSD